MADCCLHRPGLDGSARGHYALAMNRTRSFTGLLVLLVAGAAAVLSAGERQGLTAGLGIGLGVTHAPRPWSWDDGPEDEVARTFFSAAFPQLSLGYAPSNRLDLHGTMKSSVYDFRHMGKMYHDFTDLVTHGLGVLLLPLAPVVYVFIPVFHAHHLLGAGATYYLKPAAPSPYFEADVGRTPFRGGPYIGVAAGAGYEFAPNRSVELTGVWSGGPSQDSVARSLLSVSLAIKLAAY